MQPSVENVRRTDDESLSVNAYRSDGFPFVWHLHPEWELTLVAEGRGQRYVGDSVETFSPGDLVLLPGNLPHTWHAEADGTDGCASVVVFFDEPIVPPLPELRRVRKLMDRASCGLAFSGRTAEQVADQMHELEAYQGFYRLIAFWQIMDQLLRVRSVRRLSSQPFDRPFAPADHRDIDRVCRWVVDHLHGEIRQSDAARLIHRSPSAFARFFKRMMGQTFIHYVVQMRVGRACRLLIETDQPITQVALEAGFTNLSYFNRAFRQHRDATPRDFRRAFAEGG
jgi:AraC-like DNA-binding protein